MRPRTYFVGPESFTGIYYYRVTTDRWFRTWQAEWEGCCRAPRAWTLPGLKRKACRWWMDGR